MFYNRIDIPKENGENLNAYMSLPANKKATAYAVFAHCFTCNSNFRAAKSISRELTKHGFGVLRFDFTGLGMSDGEFSETNFSANVDDLILVSRYLNDNYKAPSLLVGHSLGGAAVLVAAGHIDSVEAVVTIGSPSDSAHVKHLFEDDLERIEKEGAAKVHIGGRPFKLQKQFIDDLERYRLEEVVRSLKKPILIFHSPQDTIVDIHHAANLYSWAFHPKSFVSLDGADHLLSRVEDGRYVASVIGGWAERYVMSVSAQEDPIPTQGDQVVVQLDTEDGFTSTLSNNRHSILADEPVDFGGEDLGFSPYELLISSLGACTAMTLKLYAERKKWDLREVYVYLNYDKIHHSDMDKESDEKVDRIEKRIVLKGDLSDDQKNRLLEISERCPVHKTLNSDTILHSILE